MIIRLIYTCAVIINYSHINNINNITTINYEYNKPNINDHELFQIYSVDKCIYNYAQTVKQR